MKGIGIWTSQMFLMFKLGRPDVLPDLAGIDYPRWAPVPTRLPRSLSSVSTPLSFFT